MALDSTGLRIVRRGRAVMCGPFLFRVAKVTTTGQAWLAVVPPDGSGLIVRDCSALTVYDRAFQAVTPAGPAEIPLMPTEDDMHDAR